MRTVGVVSVARSDYGILRPVLDCIQRDPDLELHLIAAGMHLEPRYGLSVRLIEEDGWAIADRVDFSLNDDAPRGIGVSLGQGVAGFARSFERARPDILVLMGDRFEMCAAALAALPQKIPVAHIHGGEVTEGAMDDALRHSITKLSHLHLTATREYARRVEQLGEEPWRIKVCGAPGLDNLSQVKLMDEAELAGFLGIALDPAPLVITYHPVTLQYESTAEQVDQLLQALEGCPRPMVFTLPNADTAGSLIAQRIAEFTSDRPGAVMMGNLGTRAYFSLMARAAAMVGNSSSGIIEAPSFGLPVVNIGPRQRGRARAANVIDTECRTGAIAAGLRQALSPEFRAGLKDLENPYGDGRAAPAIVDVLKSTPLDDKLMIKHFHDLYPERLHA